MNIPFILRPAYWGMSDKDKQIKRLEFEPPSYERDLKLLELQEIDPVKVAIKTVDLQIRYNKIDARTADQITKSLKKEPFCEIVLQYVPDGFNILVEHNPEFITELKTKKYSGSDDDVVESWLHDICRSVLTDDENEVVDFLNPNVVSFKQKTENGKVEYR